MDGSSSRTVVTVRPLSFTRWRQASDVVQSRGDRTLRSSAYSFVASSDASRGRW